MLLFSPTLSVAVAGLFVLEEWRYRSECWADSVIVSQKSFGMTGMIEADGRCVVEVRVLSGRLEVELFSRS